MSFSRTFRVSTTRRRAIGSWRWGGRSKRKRGRDRRETDRRDARRPYDRRHRRRLRQSRAHENQRKNFEIVLGRINSGSCSGKVFAAVRDLDDLARERVRSALRTAGRGPATNLTVLSDGEDAMRLMAGQWLSGRVERRLDWFRLRRRFQWLARASTGRSTMTIKL